MGKGKKLKAHKPSERWKKYKITGNKIERAKTCPKCGPGMFLAVHKDRLTCGSCKYVEFNSKK